jgi:uncharacterized surface protein with fasciclin (FAS1) repeats
MLNFKTLAIALVLFAGAALPAANAATPSIVEIATGSDDFESLVEALSAQGLVDDLSGAGPFTVFAPTDDAFADLPAYVGKVLEEKPELLTSILLYHVVPGEFFAADVLKNRGLKTLEGSRVIVREKSGDVFINQSEVVTANVDASNGVVHVIDQVLIPPVVYTEAIKQLRADIHELQNQLREVLKDRAQNFRR